MRYLLDTNTTSYLVESKKARTHFKEKTRGEMVIEKIREVGYDNVYLNAVVVGEIYAGLYSKPTMKEERRKTIEENIWLWKRLNLTGKTGQIYGKIKAELNKRGKRLPDTDLLIAATAIAHRVVLVSNDRGFKRIQDFMPLKLENWVEEWVSKE